MSSEVMLVSEDSEIGRRIQEAESTGTPLRVQLGAARYVVVREDVDEFLHADDPRDCDPPLVWEKDKIWQNYDPDRVIQALRDSAGMLNGVDVEQLLADLKEQRGQDSIGRPA